MLKKITIFEESSEYYDNEMNYTNIFHFEQKCRISEYVNNQREVNCFNFFKISNSMNLTKIRCKNKAKQITNDFFSAKEKKSIDIYTIFSECFNKILSCSFLNILRNNSE